MDIFSRFRKTTKQERLKKEQQNKAFQKKQSLKRVEKPQAKEKVKQDKAKKAEEKVLIEKPTAAVGKKAKQGIIKLAPGILKSPQITEKASNLEENNQYVFKVFSTSTKSEIKKAVKEYYGVEAIDVKIINVKPKKKRLGRTTGFQKGYKKAIVKLKKGSTIEVMPR